MQVAELHRARYRLNNMVVHIVPGPNNGFREDSLPCPLEERRMMFRNIVLPVPHLYESCTGIHWYNERDAVPPIPTLIESEYQVFPRRYSVIDPVSAYMQYSLNGPFLLGESMPLITAPTEYHRLATQFLQKNCPTTKPVTITLRENPDVPERNSDTKEWSKFISNLDTKVYTPIIIRETDSTFSEDNLFRNNIHCDLAAVNILFRTALYENSYINLFVSNGPASCALHSRSRFIMFKMITEVNPSTSRDWVENVMGIKIPDQVPFLRKDQRYIWEEDKADVIMREFLALVEAVEHRPAELKQSFGLSASQPSKIQFARSILLHLGRYLPRGVMEEDFEVIEKLVELLPGFDIESSLRPLLKNSTDRVMAQLAHYRNLRGNPIAYGLVKNQSPDGKRDRLKT